MRKSHILVNEGHCSKEKKRVYKKKHIVCPNSRGTEVRCTNESMRMRTQSLPSDLAVSNIPIKNRITIKSLSQKKVIEEVEVLVVVGFIME
jgi:hypothetical protein